MQNHWNPGLYDRNHAFVARYGEDVVGLLAPQKGEKILDLGCGTGHLTAKIAELGAQVTGLDASAEMIDVARKDYSQLKWIHADARNFSLGETFDAVFTNAALHWIPEAAEVAARVFAHLKPGGRLVGEMGGTGNIAKLHGALRESARELGLAPFQSINYFPTPAQFGTVLENAGFEVQLLWLFDRPTPLEGADGAKNWLRQFCAFYLDTLDSDARETVLDNAQNRLRGVLENESGWFADYRRLRFVACKRGETI